MLYCLGEDTVHQQPPSSRENHILAFNTLLGPLFCKIWHSDPSLPFRAFLCEAGGGYLETTFLRHTCQLVGDTGGRLAGKEAILLVSWNGSFRPPRLTASQQFGWLQGWQEWELVPPAVSSCLSVSAGMWALYRFVAAFWCLGSSLCNFPLVSIALVAYFL